MARGPLTNPEVSAYRITGFVVIQQMFDQEEISLLRREAKEDNAFKIHALRRRDGEGKEVRLTLWNHPGDTIYGMFARCESLINSAELLLGGEVYYYHSKNIMKDPKDRGNVGSASKLRILVSKWRIVSVGLQCIHRG